MKKLSIQTYFSRACTEFAVSLLDSAHKIVSGPIPGVIASDIAFVNGKAINVFGKITELAQKQAELYAKDDIESDAKRAALQGVAAPVAKPVPRLVQPRKMNGVSSRNVLALCLGVSNEEIPEKIVNLINDLNAASTMNDDVYLKIIQLGNALVNDGTIGRKPGKPRKAVATPAV